MIKIRSFLPLLFLLPALAGGAPSNGDLDRQAREIADQLRCPVCRGIPVADSPSTLAQDMMKMVHQKLEAGEGKDQILNYFVDRYGEWILLEPKARGLNLMVWVLPIFLLIGGGIFLAFRISSWSRPRS